MRLTSGRKEPCKDNIGGVKEIHLMTYVEYDVRSFVGYRDLLVTSFPTTQIYKYEGENKSFSETYNQDNYYEQDLTIRLTSQDLSSAQSLSILLKNKVRAIITDWLGNKKIVGIVNGLDVEITASGGGSKVDFNGYELRLTGLEELKAPFVSDLENAGLSAINVDLGCLLASSDKPASLSNKVSDCNVVL
jgi:hypothetical protein